MTRGNTLFHKNEAMKNFYIYLPTTPGNYLPTTPKSFLSADYPRPYGTTISRLPMFCNLSPDYPKRGSREIGGVYFRYFRGDWGSREIFAALKMKLPLILSSFDQSLPGTPNQIYRHMKRSRPSFHRPNIVQSNRDFAR